MTNQIALVLGLILIAALGVDQVFYDGTGTIYMGRKFLTLLYWLKFWE